MPGPNVDTQKRNLDLSKVSPRFIWHSKSRNDLTFEKSNLKAIRDRERQRRA